MRKLLTNGLVLVVTVALGLVVAETATRIADDLPVFETDLPPSYGGGLGRDTTPEHLDEVARVEGVPREWFFVRPPPLPNRHAVPEQWKALNQVMVEWSRKTGSPFRPVDMFKDWNAAFVGNPCDKEFFANLPAGLSVFEPIEGEANPPYRFPINATTPERLVTNEFGWRGPPVQFARSPRSIRIVFVGASTVANPHTFPYSMPEWVGHWLNMWTAARRPDIRIEVMNAARESLNSTSIEAVVRQEVAPVRPDLVVYSEGGNQFELDSIVRNMPSAATLAQARPVDGLTGWLRAASRYSALARRVQSAVGLAGLAEGAREVPKPNYEIHWPQGLDESDPDLAYPDLPLSLNVIQRDLDRIRADLAAVDSEFAITSFIWAVKDGMIVDPIRNKVLWEDLNVRRYPYRYRDLERLAAFQNRLLAKYAAAHGLPFIDVAGRMPFDSDLFADAVHETESGGQLKAWVILQQLVQIIEQRLASGTWPKPLPVPPMGDVHPAFVKKPWHIPVDCKPGKPVDSAKTSGIKP